MDYKIRDIELASFYLAWQHTAFYKPRDSAASFRIGRNRETITRSDDPPPASQDPIASLNVSIRVADFVSDHKVCCSFYYAHTLIHCRGPPVPLIPKIRCTRGEPVCYIGSGLILVRFLRGPSLVVHPHRNKTIQRRASVVNW